MKHCIPIAYGVFTSMLINVCFYKVVEWTDEAIDGLSAAKGNLDYIHQIKRDWETAPFVDIIVTEETVCPESHPDLVFSRPYYGTDTGCNCLGVWQEREYKDRFGQTMFKHNPKNALTP